jgi:hypothetical protein
MEDKTFRNDADLKELFSRLDDIQSPHTSCFLCGCSLVESNATSEHVFPRWAQNRYELWNQQIVLLNRTSIPYRQFTVPCCEDCNKYRLKPLEDSLSQTVEQGREAVLSLGKRLLFLWLGKIFYGTLYKEMMLLFDRSSPQGQRIITPEFARHYRMHRFFLQQAREVVQPVNFDVGSIHVFSMQSLPTKRLEWDFCDNIDSMFVGCRVGRVGLIAVLGDGGAQQFFEDDYSDVQDIDLHPIQFRELCAQFSYRSILATRTPKYITVSGSPHIVHQMPLGGFSAKPLFEEWDQAIYAQVLAHYIGEDICHLFSPPDKVMTWLHTPDGQPRFMSFKEFPILPKSPE